MVKQCTNSKSRGGRKSVIQFGNTRWQHPLKHDHKQSPFKIIIKGEQGCTPTDFRLKKFCASDSRKFRICLSVVIKSYVNLWEILPKI